MLNKNGQLILSDCLIFPLMDINEFKKLKIFESVSEQNRVNEEYPYIWYYLFHRVNSEELSYSLNFCFFKGNLKFIEFSISSEHIIPDWKNWSLENEYDKQIFFDQWLKCQLGEKPYAYPWGKVRSVFNPRVQAAFILIEYQKEQITKKWWQIFHKN